MKQIFFLFACAMLSAAGSAQAIPRQPMTPPHQGTPAPPQDQTQRPERIDRPYDTSKEEMIKAKVLEVKELIRGPRTVIAIVVDVDGEEAQVAIGTKEYLAEHKISFAVGDSVTIKGIKNDTPLQALYAMRQGAENAPTPAKNRAEATGGPTDDNDRQRLRIRARELIKGGKTLTVLNSEGRFVWLPDRAEPDNRGK